jgi:hypothetical protein
VAHGSKKYNKKIKKYFRLNDNKNIAYKTWFAVKVMLQRKLISMKAYIRKEKSSQINILRFHLRKLEQSN